MERLCCPLEKIKAGIAITPDEACIRCMRSMDFTIEVVLTNGKGKPVDISLDTIKLRIYDERGGTLKIEKTSLPGTHVDGLNGRTSFTIGRTDIESDNGKTFSWLYEVRRIEDTLEERVHLTGPFVVDPPVGG
jgi:hypothetical protein